MVDLVSVGFPRLARSGANRLKTLRAGGALCALLVLGGLLLVAASAQAAHTRLLVGNDVQMGIGLQDNYQGHHDAPASLGTGTQWATLRYSPTGSMGAAYEGVARETGNSSGYDAWLSWGASAMGAAGAGGCRQTPALAVSCTSSAGATSNAVYTPPTPVISQCSSHWYAVSSPVTGTLPNGQTATNFLVWHDYCPVKDNVFQNNVTIVNRFVDVTVPSVHYRRAMEWNTETLPANMGAPQYVTVGGTTPPPPSLVAFGDDGRAPFSPWAPFASPVCAASGAYFANCTAGKGFVFDLNLGDILPEQEAFICIFYGGAPSYEEALAELRELDVELYSIAYRGSDSPATFFMGIGCLSPPIVDFTWAAEPHIHAPPDWTPLTACVGSKVTFSDLSYINGLVKGTPAKSAWSFGDGNGASTSWSASVEHTYTSPGPYNVSLTVWAEDDRNITVTKTIEVIECLPPPPINEAPVLMAVPCRTVTEGSIVRFTLTAYDPDVPPDPVQFYTLSYTLEGAPPGAQVLGNVFHWEASVLGEHRFMLRVQDNGAPPLSDETEVCITVYPQPPAPESSDADGDGVPDAHDPCPATAGAAGCPKDDDPTQDNAGGQAGREGSGSGCNVRDLVPRDVEARLEEDRAVITWRAPPDCFIDRFLVWNGTQGDLIASVPFDPDVEVYEVVDPDPWDQPHRYYVQAEGGPGVDVFVYPRAVATEPVVFLACPDCDAGRPPEPAGKDVPPIRGSAGLLDAGKGLAGTWLPWVLVALVAWWLWQSYGMFVRLFSRLDEKTALDHPTRTLLHGIVVAEPGVHAREIVRRSAKPRGVVRHHLKILVATGLLNEEAIEGHTRYFPTGARAAAAEAALLQSDVAREVLERVQERPGISVTELARQVGVTNKAVRYHVHRFAQAGLVDMKRTKAGFTVRALPREAPSHGSPG